MTPGSRLTLSWVGKDQALILTPGGGYQLVSRDDPRFTEVRLLRDVGSIEEQAPNQAGSLLIRGDLQRGPRPGMHP